MTYTTKGDVRGCCGHKHKTIETAAKCLRGDQGGCRSQGGYSDRQVVRSNGEQLSEGDYYAIDDLMFSQR